MDSKIDCCMHSAVIEILYSVDCTKIHSLYSIYTSLSYSYLNPSRFINYDRYILLIITVIYTFIILPFVHPTVCKFIHYPIDQFLNFC